MFEKGKQIEAFQTIGLYYWQLFSFLIIRIGKNMPKVLKVNKAFLSFHAVTINTKRGCYSSMTKDTEYNFWLKKEIALKFLYSLCLWKYKWICRCFYFMLHRFNIALILLAVYFKAFKNTIDKKKISYRKKINFSLLVFLHPAKVVGQSFVKYRGPIWR